MALNECELVTIKEAFASPKWTKTAQDEYEALKKNNTWELVHIHANRRSVGCKWVFKLKWYIDGSIAWHKDRLVVKGYSKEVGVDFHETSSPVIKPQTICVVFFLSVSFG